MKLNGFDGTLRHLMTNIFHCSVQFLAEDFNEISPNLHVINLCKKEKPKSTLLHLPHWHCPGGVRQGEKRNLCGTVLIARLV